MKQMFIGFIAFLASAMCFAEHEKLLGQVVLGDQDFSRRVIHLHGICGSVQNPYVDALKFEVQNNVADINQVNVELEDGTLRSFPINRKFNPGMQTPWFAMRGVSRCVNKIEIIGDSANQGNQAMLKVYGRVAVQVARGEFFLGQAFLADQDFSRVPILLHGMCGSPQNPYITAIKLQVEGNRADINQIELHLENGEIQKVNFNQVLNPGTSTAWVDLRGEARCVKRASVVGDSADQGRQASVRLLGRVDVDLNEGEYYLGRTLMNREDYSKHEIPIRVLGQCGSPHNPFVTALRFEVLNNVADVNFVAVVMGDKSKREFVVQPSRMQPGQESRWYDLPGQAGCVEKLVVIGDGANTGTPTLLRIVGKMFR